ncbi:Tryptophan aminotransferase-related protein [Actinidia chinensis var. chinensis]|uniref:Tryptophan aminotransferase-related protein n=1 Tax=Actinidia chinensis var. chinensis TaxID=1590841 RepID=A0A2R6QGL3_ACTCC|nr:Tryptophan aminotransferase-related protein [Actinidia chinensis var. chinensis]
MVSMALNVGLILRLGYVRETWRAEQSLHGFGLEEKSQSRVASMAASSQKVAHVSRGKQVVSIDGTEIEDGGERVINLDHGDPTMYERFWQQTGDKNTFVISGWQYISYFSDVTNLCWFLEPEFAKAVVRLHKLVGNAITEDRYIVVGTGSTQLFQAALYALCPPNASEPMNVVSAAPFYSSYPLMTDFLKSGLYKWGGDAHKFSTDGPYIELVTSPNNPDGSTRQAVVNRNQGILMHDFAYYWPQYTPISFPADHDLMLFTVSKSTGHAGTRIGWALVKDKEVARKMTKFIEINTIGVSKDSQLRAARILQAVADSCDRVGSPEEVQPFFDYSYILMEKRWKQLRAAVKKSGLFSLPDFPSKFCNFSGRTFESQPGKCESFAWLKCEGEIEDCESFLRCHRILTRGGKHFGVCPKYVRISMLERDEMFDLFTERLSQIKL